MPLTRLFPPQKLSAMQAQLRRFAAEFGIVDLATRDHLPNTHRALAVAEYARSVGRLDAFRKTAMHAYWREGRDLENADDIRAIAFDAMIDPERAVRAMSDPAMLARVDGIGIEAHIAGVHGIPAFFFGATQIVGCLPYDVLANAARTAGAVPRPR
jgi:predicted DsbA family dithiol-disulfide isomerase